MVMALVAMSVSAKEGDATSAVFNVSQYSSLGEIDLKNCTTLYKYDESAKAIILTAYGAYQSSVKSLDDETKKGLGWVTYNSAGSSNVADGWAATGVFQGSAYYGLLSSGSASHRAAAINSSRAYTFTVTGCKAVSILGKSGKKTEREVILTVKESGSDANFAEKKDATNEIVTLTVDGMDASKTYEVTVTGNTSDNGHFYEIAFYIAASDNSGDDAGNTETELTLTEGHTLLIETLEAAGAKDDDIVRFYVSDTSGAGRNGWGIGGFANSDNWSPIVEWTGKEGESWTYEYTVAQIKEVAGTTPGEYHGIGITINIYNDCKVDKVTLVKNGSSGIQQTIAPAKVIENNVIYNLAGQKVNETYKGIVIKNGKKYFQK